VTGAAAHAANVDDGIASAEACEGLAQLLPLAEEMVATGMWTFDWIHKFSTAAGICAAAAGEWTRAAEHHNIALHRTDKCAMPAEAACRAESGGRKGCGAGEPGRSVGAHPLALGVHVAG
jgi:hypothetical protein